MLYARGGRRRGPTSNKVSGRSDFPSVSGGVKRQGNLWKDRAGGKQQFSGSQDGRLALWCVLIVKIRATPVCLNLGNCAYRTEKQSHSLPISMSESHQTVFHISLCQMCFTFISRKWLNLCYSESGLTLGVGKICKLECSAGENLGYFTLLWNIVAKTNRCAYMLSQFHFLLAFDIFFFVVFGSSAWVLLGLHSRVSGSCGVHRSCLRCSDVFSVRVPGRQQWQHFIVQTAAVARGQMTDWCLSRFMPLFYFVS